jgi:hypothetical protein
MGPATIVAAGARDFGVPVSRDMSRTWVRYGNPRGPQTPQNTPKPTKTNPKSTQNLSHEMFFVWGGRGFVGGVGVWGVVGGVGDPWVSMGRARKPGRPRTRDVWDPRPGCPPLGSAVRPLAPWRRSSVSQSRGVPDDVPYWRLYVS